MRNVAKELDLNPLRRDKCHWRPWEMNGLLMNC